MSSNNFKPRKYEDFEIVNSTGAKVGAIRVKPSGVLWKPVNTRKWYGVKLDTFADFMEENGRRQNQ
jgi:hypothetical protein